MIKFTKGTCFLTIPMALMPSIKTKDMIFLIIFNYCIRKDEGKATIFSKEIEEIAGVDRDTVYNITRELEDAGLISISKVKSQYSNYILTEYTLNVERINSICGDILETPNQNKN